MAGTKKINSDLIIEGKVTITTMSNYSGNVVIYNVSTGELGNRTQGEFISDAGLATTAWVNTNHIPKSHPVFGITQATINTWNLSVPRSTETVAAVNNHQGKSRFINVEGGPLVPASTSTYWNVINFGEYNGGNYNTQLAMPYQNAHPVDLYLRRADGGVWQDWVKVWHSSNFNPNDKENAFSKKEAFNRDFGSTSGTVAEGDDSRIINGQTAFGWGNHASQGYLKSVTNISGNAGTATSLQTARSINGTSFNGTSNIVTSYWGTARNITIGKSTKSVNGSGNVSYSLEDIGASSSWVQSQRDFENGTLIKTSIAYISNTPFLLEIKGNMYGDGVPLDAKLSGYCYNNTVINVFGYSTNENLSYIRIVNDGGKLAFWFPRMGYWHGFSVKCTIQDSTSNPNENRVDSIINSSGTHPNPIVCIMKAVAFKDEITPTVGMVAPGNAVVRKSDGKLAYDEYVSFNYGVITAASFVESSLRKFKTNIKPFTANALDLINGLEIVTFDRTDTKVSNKIGVIADDTDVDFLSQTLDSVDLYKTIFIQAKAIQELTDRIKKLEKNGIA